MTGPLGLMPDGLPRPNLPLLRKVLDHIDAHPEEWNQQDWASDSECGTAFCIAGHAVAMTEGVVGSGFGALPSSGRGWIEAAEDALGLFPGEGRYDGDANGSLFFGQNTRADVQRHAEAIAARAGERL